MLAMSDAHRASCTTCYGTGEIVTDQGGFVCPDCLGQGLPPARGGAMEWRLRELERAHLGATHRCQGGVRLPIPEPRPSRGAPAQILTPSPSPGQPVDKESA